MIKKEIAAVAISLVAVTMFLTARNIGTSQSRTNTVAGSNSPAVAAPGTSAPETVAPSTQTKTTPLVAAAPKAKAPEKIVKAPTPTPPKTAVPAAIAALPKSGRNSDDSPKRAKSGKVKVSKDTKRPPAYGPKLSKVHVIVFSDFQ